MASSSVRQQAGVVDPVVPPLVGERLVGPQPLQHVEALDEPTEPLGPRDAVAGELVGCIPLTQPDIDAAIGQDVECGDVLGHPDGVVQRRTGGATAPGYES